MGKKTKSLFCLVHVRAPPLGHTGTGESSGPQGSRRGGKKGPMTRNMQIPGLCVTGGGVVKKVGSKGKRGHKQKNKTRETPFVKKKNFPREQPS